MKFKFAMVACILFSILFGYLVIGARTRFDAAWLIATMTIPASLMADTASRLLAGWYGEAHKNIFIELSMLFLFGLVQYGLIGYLIGWFFVSYKQNNPQV